MTVHHFGSVIMKMRERIQTHGPGQVGVVVIDEQQTVNIGGRVGYQERVLEYAYHKGLQIWLFITPGGVVPGMTRRGPNREILSVEDDDALPTIQRLKNAANSFVELQKGAENCFRVAKFAEIADNMNTLVVMGKMQNSCVRGTIIDDNEPGDQKDSAVQRNIHVITSSKLMERAGTDSYFPDWAQNPLVHHFLYVGTRKPSEI